MVTSIHGHVWRRRLTLLAGFALVIVVIIYVVVQVDFRRWRRRLYVNLQSASKLANTDRGAVEYVRFGEGPVVLAMHGAPGGYDDAMPLPGFCVVSPSRPGYLRTRLSVGPTLEEQARVCAALLDSLGIHRVAVLGVSAGGPPALQFAAQYPDRTWGVVLLSAITKRWVGPLPQASVFRRVTDRTFGKDFADWLLARAVTQFPEQLLLTLGGEYLSEADRGILRQDPQKLQSLVDFVANRVGPWSLRCEGNVNDTREHARMGEHDPLPIGAPTLVIHGTADVVVDLSHAQSAAQRIPGCELVTIEGAGHLACFTHYEEIQSLVVRFLHQHAPDSSTE